MKKQIETNVKVGRHFKNEYIKENVRLQAV